MDEVRQALIDALVLDLEDVARKHLTLTGGEVTAALTQVLEQYAPIGEFDDIDEAEDVDETDADDEAA